ncbi:MAG: glycosyltransferase, partial [Nitriliruptoraceae bacterium]
SPLVGRPRPLAARVRACIERGELQLLTAADTGTDTTVDAQLVVLRHPTVAGSLDPSQLPRIRAAERLLVANQAPSTPASASLLHRPSHRGGGDGPRATGPRYDPQRVTEHLEDWLGGAVRWAPIGPLVRTDLVRVAPQLELEPEDWVNVIDVAAWRHPRDLIRSPIPVIGRHSRDDPLKWPDTREALLAAYPAGDDVEVRVLGGASGAERVLGGPVPANWQVWPFGAVPARRFLAGLEIYVYQHHPAWVEAFGRSILEAMASGLPTVLPPRFAPLFEDAAIYSEPAGVAEHVTALHGDRDHYRDASARAAGFVADRFSHAVHVRRLAALARPTGEESAPRHTAIGPPSAGAVGSMGAADPAATSDRVDPLDSSGPGRRRVLFVSSNGSGVGHLMRLMAYARHAPDDVDPVFLTFSQGAQVVADAGYPVEYLASRAISGASSDPWHRFLRERAGELIERYDVRAVVFDGTWPYRGLMEAAEDHPHVLRVWSRRAMWRAGVTNPVIEHERDRFDLVVEPGELAEDDDRGATRPYRSEAVRVGPVTALELDDMEERAVASAALGLDPERPAALVTLGAGNIDDTSSVVVQVLARLAQQPDLQIRVTRSVIAARDTALPDNVEVLSVYPLARYLRAFDLAVAAAGYNSFHELTLAAVPTVFVPNQETSTDDQRVRSSFAERIGIAVDLPTPTPATIDAALTRVLEPETRQRMHERAVARRRPGGAADAMAAIVSAMDARADSRRSPAATSSSAACGPPAQRSDASDPAASPVGPPAHRSGAPEPTASPVRPTASPYRLQSAWSAAPRRAAAGLRRWLSTAFASLPAPVRRRVRRRLRRLGWRRGEPVSANRDLIPVPAGAGIVADDQEASPAPIAIVVPSLGDVDLVDRIVERTAQLQAARGGFAPLLVLGDLAFRAARRHGYLVEYLPPREQEMALPQTIPWEDARRQRLAAIMRWYQPTRVLTLPAPADASAAELFAVLAGSLEGLDRPTR